MISLCSFLKHFVNIEIVVLYLILTSRIATNITRFWGRLIKNRGNEDFFNSLVKKGLQELPCILQEKGLKACKPLCFFFQCDSKVFIASLLIFYKKKYKFISLRRPLVDPCQCASKVRTQKRTLKRSFYLKKKLSRSKDI